MDLQTKLQQELKRNEAMCGELSQKLALATTLLQERDALHKARQETLIRECATHEHENLELKRRISVFEAKERARKAEGQSFQKDVADLEKAAQMLSDREREVETKAEDLERFTKRMYRQVARLESDLKRVKEEHADKTRELDSYKETSNRKYEDLKQELERGVSKTEHEHVKAKCEKLQRQINVNMVSVDSVGKLNAQIDMLRRQIKDEHVHRSEYEKVLHENELIKEAAQIVEESQQQISDDATAARQALPALQDRVAQLEKELVNSRQLVTDLTEVEKKQREDIEGYALQVSQLSHQVMVLETSKASLCTQLGALKVNAKRDLELSGAHLTTKRQAEGRVEQLRIEKEQVELNLRETRNRLLLLEEKNSQLETHCDVIGKEAAERIRTTKQLAAENQVLSRSVLDLTERTQQLESVSRAKTMGDAAHLQDSVASIAQRYTKQEITALATDAAASIRATAVERQHQAATAAAAVLGYRPTNEVEVSFGKSTMMREFDLNLSDESSGTGQVKIEEGVDADDSIMSL